MLEPLNITFEKFNTRNPVAYQINSQQIRFVYIS